MSQALTFRPKTAVGKYAPYWRDDSTMDPVLVRMVSHSGDWYDVRFPDGHTEQVHCHTLGVFR